MKNLACLLVTLSLTLSPCLAADKTPAGEDITLSYLEATDAFQALKSEYPEIAEIVKSIQIDTNAVSIDGNHPEAPAFRKSLAALDQPPKTVVLNVVVTEVTKSTGKESIVLRPSLLTLENKPATITVPTSSPDKEHKITITARSVPTVAKK